MKRQRPVLVELQAVDLILQLAGRDRPAGPRCTLADRRGLPPLPVERIDHALAVAEVVNALAPDRVRRCVALAMSVKNGEPEFDRAGIAAMMKAKERSVSRWLSDGLAQVEQALARVPCESYTGHAA